MSRIIAAVAVGVLALMGTAAMGAQYDELEDPSNQTEALTQIATETTGLVEFVPIVLIIALAIGAAGVIGR